MPFTCTSLFLKEFKIVQQVMLVYLMEEPVMRGFWKSAQSIKHGKQLVHMHMTSPAAMPKLFAGNWDTHNH